MNKNSLLKSIESPIDIKKIPIDRLQDLSNEVSDMIKDIAGVPSKMTNIT